MKYLSYLSLLCTFLVFSQNKEIKIPVEGTLIFTGKTAILPIENIAEGGFSFLKIDETQLQATKVDKEGTVVKTVLAEIPKGVSHFLDAIHVGNNLRLFFASENSLGYITIDYNSGEVKKLVLDTIITEKEALLAYYTINKSFYVVTISSTNVISAHVFNNQEIIKKITFNTTEELPYKNWLIDLLLSKNEPITIIKEGEAPSFSLQLNNKKIYVSENRFTMTVGNAKGKNGEITQTYTDIFRFNLNDETIQYYPVLYPRLSNRKNSKAQKNVILSSQIIDNLIFQMVLDKDELTIQVVNFVERKLLKKYYMDNKNFGEFENAENIVIPTYGVGKKYTVDSPNKFMISLGTSIPVLVVTKQIGFYSLDVIALNPKIKSIHRLAPYKSNNRNPPFFNTDLFKSKTTNFEKIEKADIEFSKSAFSNSFFKDFLFLGVNFGNAPNYGTLSSIYFNEKEVEMQRANFVVESATFETVSKERPASIIEKSRSYEDKLRDQDVRLVKPTIFKIKDALYFNYFSIKDRSFIIQKLDK